MRCPQQPALSIFTQQATQHFWEKCCFLLAVAALLLGAKVVIEFHEVLDTGEARLPLARTYVRLFAPLLLRLAHGFVIHSEYDRKMMQRPYKLENRPIVLIPHGPYNHCQITGEVRGQRNASTSCCNLLFFGVIRPFKGLEDLITAFDAFSQSEAAAYWLTVVGEMWEGWTLLAELIARSQYRDRITFVNRYVSDAEVARCKSRSRRWHSCAAGAMLTPIRGSVRSQATTGCSMF